ncbi:MAG: hypothetical protein U0T75_13905 [Chitinophagales bacterium]
MKNIISTKDSWWIILLGLFLWFLLAAGVRKGPLGIIEIHPDTVKAIIDQRTANIATIISVTLVVVGFLINNLAIKDTYAYHLLFKHSLLYPIMYLVLMTIGSLMIFSLLRDHLPFCQLIDIVVAATYIVLLILFCIGLLFTRILKFANREELREILRQEFIFEAKEDLKYSLIKKYSANQYLQFMKSIGVERFDFITALRYPSKITFSDTPIVPLQENEVVIQDINLKKIEKTLERLKNDQPKLKVITDELMLDSSTSPNALDYIRINEGELSEAQSLLLRSSLILSRPKATANGASNYFNKKFIEFTKERDHEGLRFVLNTYEELYNLKYENKFAGADV